jgi:iron-sulfur cluster assembly protein
MLEMTPNAVAALCAFFYRPGTPETAGVRIAQGEDRHLALSTALEPEPGDRVVEKDGARLFLEPVVAGALDDMVLDANVEADGRVRFVFAGP